MKFKSEIEGENLRSSLLGTVRGVLCIYPRVSPEVGVGGRHEGSKSGNRIRCSEIPVPVGFFLCKQRNHNEFLLCREGTVLFHS